MFENIVTGRQFQLELLFIPTRKDTKINPLTMEIINISQRTDSLNENI